MAFPIPDGTLARGKRLRATIGQTVFPLVRQNLPLPTRQFSKRKKWTQNIGGALSSYRVGPGPLTLTNGNTDSLVLESSRSGRAIAEFVEEGGNLIVTLSKPRFRAVYYKPTGRPQLILRERTKTDHQEILAGAWKAANAKARELGWIV